MTFKPFKRRKAARIDLRDTHTPGSSDDITRRGFVDFDVVDAEIRFKLERTLAVITIMDRFSSWYELEFVIESTIRRDREEGIDALDGLVRALGFENLGVVRDTEEIVGRMAAFRVSSAEGDVEFRPLSELVEQLGRGDRVRVAP